MNEIKIRILSLLKEYENGLSFGDICAHINKDTAQIRLALYALLREEEVHIINKKYHGII